ncbi:MAG: hypothetical protein ACFBSE_15985 [Prochloraceae cyanobacterium]
MSKTKKLAKKISKKVSKKLSKKLSKQLIKDLSQRYELQQLKKTKRLYPVEQIKPPLSNSGE